MKNLHLFPIFLLLIFTSKTNCRDNDSLTRYIGITALSYRLVGSDFSSLMTIDRIRIANGICFRQDYRMFTTRYSFSINRKKDEVVWMGPDSYSGALIQTFFSFTAGLQKNYSFLKGSFYYGLDAMYNPYYYKIDLEGGIDGEGQHDKHFISFIGIQPVIGFHYAIYQKLTLAIESSYVIDKYVFQNSTWLRSPDYRNYWNPFIFTAFYKF